METERERDIDRDREGEKKGKAGKKLGKKVRQQCYFVFSFSKLHSFLLSLFSFLFFISSCSPHPLHCTHSTSIPSFTSLLSISVNRTSKASELDGEWQCLLLVCRQTCLLQSVSLKALAKCLSRLKAIVLVSSPLRSQTSPFLSLYLPLSLHFCTLMEHFTAVCVCVYKEAVMRQCLCVCVLGEFVHFYGYVYMCGNFNKKPSTCCNWWKNRFWQR